MVLTKNIEAKQLCCRDKNHSSVERWIESIKQNTEGILHQVHTSNRKSCRNPLDAIYGSSDKVQ